ncbi:nuclear transport factor 2 family protein [Candidatus Poriferisodalis sp.]|uniref:nuclear transport factor 2 family protein n=1 Tax=Candidatus Poriferisodalis sp. TaxID=3101277 RepID=UPI003B024C8A
MPAGENSTADASLSVGDALVRALNARDLDAAMALCDPDGEAVLPHLAAAGTLGAEGRAYFSDLLAAFADLRVTVRASFLAADPEHPDGTVETVEVRTAGTQSDDFLGITNQEKYCDLDQAWRLTIAPDGKITRLRGFWDQTILLRRLAVRRLDDINITEAGQSVTTPPVATSPEAPHIAAAS